MAQGASRLSRPLLPGLDFDAPPALRKPGRQNPMHYKTIVLELPNQYPTLDEELRAERATPRAPDRSSTDLKAGHHFGTEQIAQARPHTAPDQMASVAPEMALVELQNRLSAESQTSWILVQPLSLEGARASIRRHTPHD